MRSMLRALGVLLVPRSRKTAYCKSFVAGVKFLIHFTTVLLILSFGAIVLAVLEDPDIMYGKDANALQSSNGSISNASFSRRSERKHYDHFAQIWAHLQSKYNVTIREEFESQALDDLSRYLQEALKQFNGHGTPESVHAHSVPIHSRGFIFMKWFYFATVSATTIGYGHVYPTTDRGKLFFIPFSIIGIVAMMTLLGSCGKILTRGNKKLYTLVSRYICKEKEYISDQLMSVVSICLFFSLFMLFVVWYDQHIGTHLEETWPLVDTFYFWMVTFTTIGFGDRHFPLEVEIEHFYEMLLFRVIGLSFLAAIIESIHFYIKYRKRLLIIQSKPRLRKIARVMIPDRTKSEPDTESREDAIVSYANLMYERKRITGGRR